MHRRACQRNLGRDGDHSRNRRDHSDDDRYARDRNLDPEQDHGDDHGVRRNSWDCHDLWQHHHSEPAGGGTRVPATVSYLSRIGGVTLLMMLSASCSRTSSAPKPCLQFSSDLMPDLAGGLIRKDFRIANVWAVKSDQMIDSSGVKFPAYFLSADIIAPSGEAVPGTWVTTEITKPGLIWSVSPQAQKYTSWAKAGDASTTGITMESAGAKESVACVLSGRPASPQTGVTPKATTP